MQVPLAPPALGYCADERTADVWSDVAVEKLSYLEHTCSLDVADDGASHHATEIAALLGVSKTYAQREINAAIRALKDAIDASSKGGGEGAKNGR